MTRDERLRTFYRKIVAEHPDDVWLPESVRQVNPMLDSSSYEDTVHACMTVIEFLADMTTLNAFDEMLTDGGRGGLCTVLTVVADALKQAECYQEAQQDAAHDTVSGCPAEPEGPSSEAEIAMVKDVEALPPDDRALMWGLMRWMDGLTSKQQQNLRPQLWSDVLKEVRRSTEPAPAAE